MGDGRRLSGVWPILVTPFDEADEIDRASLVRGTLAVGVDGVVALDPLALRELDCAVAALPAVEEPEGIAR